MPDSNRTTRAERSATLPSSTSSPNDPKTRQHRHAAHRHHASHHFQIHRHPVKEGAQQLGNDIVNFLNPSRSAAPSAAPSRTVSRRPSADGLQLATQAAREAGISTLPATQQIEISWQDVDRIRNSVLASEHKLTADHNGLSEIALANSRQIDVNIQRLREGMMAASQGLRSLRLSLATTNAMFKKVTNEMIPSKCAQHEKQLQNLQRTYDNIESMRIGGLERRLEECQSRLQVMRQRMDKVHQDVNDCESRDATELKRSRERHFIFWAVLSLFTLTLVAVLLPKSTSSHEVGDSSILKAESEIGPDILGNNLRWEKPLSGPLESTSMIVEKSDASHFKIFDEL